MRTMLTLAGVCALLTSTVLAGDVPAKRCIALVNAGAVDTNTLERLRRFAQAELDVPVRSASIPKYELSALHEGSTNIVKVKTAADVCMIGLVSPDKVIPKHMVVLPDAHIAVVNVKAMAADDPEKFARRLERQVMRSAAFLMGLPPSPDPYDVTRHYRSMEDLDAMGRNFCAPWKQSWQRAAATNGLQPVTTVSTRGQKK